MLFVKTLEDGTAEEGETVFEEGKFAFKLRHSESISFSRIPLGTAYSVEASGAKKAGYSVSCSGKLSGTLDSDLVLEVENHKDKAPDPGAPKTGDSSDIPLFAALGAGALLAALLAVFTGIKKRRG